MDEPGRLRIGELSRRSGVSPELLRAWERRYRLLRPTRSQGGLRLYSWADLERVQAMQRHLAEGYAAAEAASLATQHGVGGEEAPLGLIAARRELDAALSAFDEPRAQAAVDALLAAATLDLVLADVVIPYLHDLGERWERGEASVAQEHFASTLLRGRLLALARGWGRGLGPRALLACPPGEQHDLGLIAFGLALRARGWRIVYFGADTPLESIGEAARLFEPLFVVLSSVSADRFRPKRTELRRLAKSHRVCLGGVGAAGGADTGALLLTGDPVEEAERLTRLAGEAEGP